MLPKIKHPTFEFVVPSTKKKETFRPFLVKEEKILLLAKSSEDKTDILRALKQVVNNCAISSNFDIDKLTIFDLEYLFLKLRSVSVNNIAKVAYQDNEDQQIYEFDIDLNTIEVKFPEKSEQNIKVTKDIIIKMKYPSVTILDDKGIVEASDDSYFDLVLKCIDKIFDGEDVYDVQSSTKEELEEFLDQLSTPAFNKIQNFMNEMPKLYHELEYVNKNGNLRKIELSSLTDFFTLG